MAEIQIVGAGLAGAEAAWQAAERGCLVHLYEMRPAKMTPVHQTGDFAELVCSNSLRAKALENAVGLLKEEMRHCHSLIMKSADINQLPAGGALAVDRVNFARYITKELEKHPLIKVIREEIPEIPREGVRIMASGPLTSDSLTVSMAKYLGTSYLYFYDAVAPIILADSINYDIVFRASRYDKGEADYLNCPMTEEEYNDFYDALLQGTTSGPEGCTAKDYFAGCMPIEEMARRGRKTLVFGPMKPVGLIDPRTGKQPYAVVQLRQDNGAATLFNMVGFQTHLKWGEQGRIFQQIPGLEQAEFARFGVIHRNTFINSPTLLQATLQVKQEPSLLFAGQITGVEGYVESAASGLIAGINGALLAQKKDPVTFPRETAMGSMCYYITNTGAKHFQPMNVTFGLMPALDKKIRDKREKNRQLAWRAVEALTRFQKEKFN